MAEGEPQNAVAGHAAALFLHHLLRIDDMWAVSCRCSRIHNADVAIYGAHITPGLSDRMSDPRRPDLADTLLHGRVSAAACGAWDRRELACRRSDNCGVSVMTAFRNCVCLPDAIASGAMAPCFPGVAARQKDRGIKRT